MRCAFGHEIEKKEKKNWTNNENRFYWETKKKNKTLLNDLYNMCMVYMATERAE